MIFGNLNNLTIIIFVILLLCGLLLFLGIYNNLRNNNSSLKYNLSTLFLFISFFFVIINIFEIKGGYNDKIESIEGGKVVFVLDVSKSMNAGDILKSKHNISRLEATKSFINYYVGKYLSNSYGLIVFAGEALETIPFTNDIGIFKTVLYGVNNSNISKHGTNLNSVFTSLGNYFSGDEQGGLAIIFTDGGDEDIDISKDLYDSLAFKGIKVLLVGVGTTSGSKIPIGKDFFGRNIYKQYKGSEVVTKLNDKVLKSISSKYSLDYISIDNIDDLSKIDKYINKNINLISMDKNINYRIDYTRFLIFISFCFFILYLFLNNYSGRKN